MDAKKISVLTLCDLSKAFDSVSHNNLLRECAKLNVDSFWISSYTKNRSKSVRINKTISEEVKVWYGVPQDSILGPISFSIYVNDLAEKIKACSLIQHADHTQFLNADIINNLNNLISNTENTLREIKLYFLTNELPQCIFIGNKKLLSRIPPETFINYDGVHIYPSTYVKHLFFDVHITELNKSNGNIDVHK